MVAAPSSPPATSAQPCGACTAAPRGPSRCWSWSLTAGKSCPGARGARGSARPVLSHKGLRSVAARPRRGAVAGGSRAERPLPGATGPGCAAGSPLCGGGQRGDPRLCGHRAVRDSQSRPSRTGKTNRPNVVSKWTRAYVVAGGCQTKHKPARSSLRRVLLGCDLGVRVPTEVCAWARAWKRCCAWGLVRGSQHAGCHTGGRFSSRARAQAVLCPISPRGPGEVPGAQ